MMGVLNVGGFCNIGFVIDFGGLMFDGGDVV